MGSSDLMLVAAVLLIGFAAYLFVSSLLSARPDQKALSWATGDEPVKSESPVINLSRPLVHQFTLQQAAKIRNEAYRKRVERKIATAGLSRELNVDEFIGLQILWGILFPILLLFLNFSLQMGFSWWLCLAIGFAGAYFPHFYVQAAQRKRYRSVIVDLPFFIDLMALSTAAGLDFVGAIDRITEKADAASVLADELGIVLRDIRLGSSRADAMHGLASRLDMLEVTSFVNVVVDADAMGASIADVLKDQSEQMRLERFVRAEKAGARASQAILIPLIFFIFPAVFIVTLAPMALQMLYGGK